MMDNVGRQVMLREGTAMGGSGRWVDFFIFWEFFSGVKVSTQIVSVNHCDSIS